MTIAGNSIYGKTLNITLPQVGAVPMITDEYCDTSCSYLKGSFLGIALCLKDR
jgi:hypothetical protein